MWARKWVDLRDGEQSLVLLSAGTLFGLVAAHTMLETARDALFLEKLPASRLAWVYALLAGLSLIAARLNTAFVARFGRRNALVFTLMTTAFGTTLLYLGARTPMMAFALYVWSALIGTVVVTQFWMLSGHVFTVAQGKRLFGPLAAGGVLGAVAGASASALLLRATDVGALLLVSPCVQLMTAVLATSLPTDPISTARTKTGGTRNALGQVLEDPYLLRLGGLLMAITAAALIGDYLFKSVAATAYSGKDLPEMLARYYAVLNGASLVVQLGVASYTVRRIGVVASVAILPALLSLGGAGVIVTGGVVSAVLIAKGFEGALRHSLHRVSTELLWLPVPGDLRNGAKAITDTVLGRGTQALVAGGILALASFGLDTPRVLGAILTVISVAGTGFAVGLKRPYVALFRRALARDPTEGDSAAMELNLDSVEVVLENLSSRDDAKVVASIDLLVSRGRGRLVPSLILYHDSAEVLVHALERVCTPERRDWPPLAERLLRHPQEQVRLAAVRALVSAERHSAVAQVMSDASPAVRAQIAFSLVQHEKIGDPIGDERIAQLLETTGGDALATRQALLEAIGQGGDARWSAVVLEIARDAGEAMNEALARAAGRVREELMLPILIRRLSAREGRSGIRQAIVSYGDAGIDAVASALRDPATDSRVRLHLPRTLSQFGNQRAADLLTNLLTSEPSGAVRFKALRGLGRLMEDHPVTVDRDRVIGELKRNLVEVLRLRALALPLERLGEKNAPLAGPLLLGLLQDKQQLATERVFRMLKLIHRSEDLRLVYGAWLSSDKHRRASALEFLDTMTLSFETLGEDYVVSRQLLRVLADDLSAAEQVRRAARYLPAMPASAAQALSALMREPDRALATLAAECASALDVSELRREVESAVQERRFITLELEPIRA